MFDFITGKKTPFEDAMELTGHGKFNYLVLITCGFILLSATMESLGSGFILTSAECELALTNSEKGLINSSVFIGIVTTAIIWGYLSDRMGRKAIMIPSICIACFLSFCSSLATSFWIFFALRFLTGCMVSASSATVFAYLGEMHTNAYRPSAFAWASCFLAASFVLLPGLGWLIIPGTWLLPIPVVDIQITSWRVYMWFWCVPGILAAILLSFLPESPRFLVTISTTKALKCLNWIYAMNNKHGGIGVSAIEPPENMNMGFMEAIVNLKHILKPPLCKCIIISYISMFMVFLLASGMYTWMPMILDEALANIDANMTMCGMLQNRETSNPEEISTNSTECEAHIATKLYPVSMGIGVLCASTYLAIGFVVKMIGNIKLYCMILFTSSLVLGVSMAVPVPVLAVGLFIFGMSAGCAASVLSSIVVEVLPTSFRALGLCTLYMCGRLGAAVGANLLGTGLDDYCSYVFIGSACAAALSTFLMLLWPDPSKVREVMEGRGFHY